MTVFRSIQTEPATPRPLSCCLATAVLARRCAAAHLLENVGLGGQLLTSWRLIELVCFVPRTDIDAAISPAIRKATGTCPTKQQVGRNLPRAAYAMLSAGAMFGERPPRMCRSL